MGCYRIIASDMDETFLAHDHTIPPANLEALRRMRELGMSFVPASGRPYSSILLSITPEMRELIEGSYIISLNGACINRLGIDEPITSHAMGFELIDEVFQLAQDFEVSVQVYEMSGRVWGWGQDEGNAAEMARLMDFRMLPSRSIAQLAEVPLAKILLDRRDLPYLHGVADEVRRKRPELVTQTEITYSSGRFLEFCPKGIDKALGISDLCSILGIGADEVVAMGDSLNDLPMIEAAGLGIAVANATDDVDARAAYVTKASCDEGALAEVVGLLADGRL